MDKFWFVSGAIVLAGMIAACSVSRPVGDFGRAAPSWTHDTAMPAAGDLVAEYGRQEPVSKFNKTDQENEMHDRVWRFLVAAHAKDWLFDTHVELQRTRITPPRDETFTVERYYLWLKGESYNSSRTRYATVGRHVTADIDTLPTTFAAICAVVEIDRQRAVAYAGLNRQIGPNVGENMRARKYENDAFIDWFVRALNYRFSSYDYALDMLLVETPHEQSIAVDDALRRMKTFVDRANRYDFCGDGGRLPGQGTVVIPSRYQHSGDTEVVLPK
ncbi:MAG: hypothetical protein P0Y65_11375 [Candidatus Devosia phytovorans]|uniref:Uncharacterized protein n=1 Tax=Candidatus Devosia phytovorans TaxID=3121372 RepID=A0AAJ6AXR9_9HYPH|nr:hypothetical protein [Devosia sp.]WEK02810.1 MAG: hypothetical protein P0Y65_11375 [Devosia sp.]